MCTVFLFWGQCLPLSYFPTLLLPTFRRIPHFTDPLPYMKLANIKVGLLINFNVERLKKG
ncbi:MAG: GxxExxY protein [bacterium]